MPHATMPVPAPVPVADPAVWTAADLGPGEPWVHRLTPAMLAEVEAATRPATAAGIEPGRMRRRDFPLDEAAGLMRAVHDDLESGRGFAGVRGLPVGRVGERASVMAFCGLAAHVGDITVQNSRGDLVVDVVDKGLPYSETSRGYSSNKLLPFHTDGANLAGLLCLGTAAEGGRSVLVSSPAIHNEIARTRPDLMDVLLRGFHHHRRGEQPAGEPNLSPDRISVFSFHGGLLHCCYNRNPVEWAAKEGVVLTEREREALDLVDALAARPDLHVATDLQVGDLQFVNNFTVLHSRGGYVDGPGRRRHLVRLWLNDPRSRRHGPTLLDLYAPEASLNRAPV